MERLESIRRLSEECLRHKLSNVAEEVPDLGLTMAPSRDEIHANLLEIQRNLSTTEMLWPESESMPYKAKQLLAPFVALVGELHDETKPWSSQDLSRTVRSIAVNLELMVTGKRQVFTEDVNIGEMLLADVKTGVNPRKSLYFICLQYLRQKLKPDLWKYYPAAVSAFRWLVFQLKYPYLSDYVGSVVAPCLLFVDDYNVENKLLGLEMLEYILCNVNRADLLQENWGLVIYNALLGSIYDSNAQVIRSVVSLLGSVLCIIEVNPNENCHKFTKYDEAMKKFLFAMEACSVNSGKLAWVYGLTHILQIMGHATLHWCHKIYDALLSLTTTNDKDLWMAVLECLRVSVKNTWVKPDSTKVAEIILRIVFNCSVLDIPGTNKTDRDHIIKVAHEIMKLMRQVCSDFEKVESQIAQMKECRQFHPDFLSALENFND